MLRWWHGSTRRSWTPPPLLASHQGGLAFVRITGPETREGWPRRPPRQASASQPLVARNRWATTPYPGTCE